MGEGVKENKKPSDTDNSMVTSRGKVGGGRWKRVNSGQMVAEGDWTSAAERAMQCADDVWQGCALEAHTTLLTNVTPVNSTKN